MNYFEGEPTSFIGLPVRFVSGKLNGFEGIIKWACDNWCAVFINYDNKPMEVVEHYSVLMPLSEWKKSKSETELTLKGSK